MSLSSNPSPTGSDSGARATGWSDATISAVLAAMIIGAWVTAHVFGVFFFNFAQTSWLWAIPIVALLTWLTVGLFIVAHDCMHGSFVPFRPAINRAVGTLCLALYAGFSFKKFNPKHHEHHRFAGTHDDPDFHDEVPHDFLPWFYAFMREHFGLREYLVINAIVFGYYFVLGAELPNILVFWALPAMLSAMQLFYFGTYLPHKPRDDVFTDRHRTRSNDYSWFVSLLTCFHFGYHHEHHDHPNVPWWKLPRYHNPVGLAPRDQSKA